MFSSTTTAKTAVAGIALAAAVALPLIGGSAAFAVGDATVPPTANNDHYFAQQDTPYVVSAFEGLLANDNSGGNSGLAVQGVLNSSGGTMIADSDGSFTFTPDPGFVGQVHLTYIDVAGGFTSNIADIYIDVNAAPAPAPLANPDFYSTPQDTVLTVDIAQGLLANDVSALEVNFSDDATGELLVNVGGHFTYWPAPGFVGTKTFSYTMTDGTTTSNLALVTIEVTAAPISVIPSNPGDNPGNGNPGDGGGSDDPAKGDLATLAYTGADDVTAWLIAPAVALVALGGLGIWFARRRSATD